MKVILTKKVNGLGLEGDVVNVKEGYARNYLFPKGLALEATEGNIRLYQQKKKTYELKEIKKKEEAQRIKGALEQISLTIKRKSQEEGKIFGSVTNSDIAEALAKKGFNLDKKKIVLEKPIRSLGEFYVPVKLLGQIEANVRVLVEAE
jgi:large subunit ribosomal protein L9